VTADIAVATENTPARLGWQFVHVTVDELVVSLNVAAMTRSLVQTINEGRKDQRNLLDFVPVHKRRTMFKSPGYVAAVYCVAVLKKIIVPVGQLRREPPAAGLVRGRPLISRGLLYKSNKG